MNASEPTNGIRVLCLHDGAEPQTPLPPELLAAGGRLHFLGSFDIRRVPFERVVTLQPDVVILQLPMSALHISRWISYIRMGWQNCAILVTGPLDVPYYRQSALSYGADEFIPDDKLAYRLLPSIVALRQKQIAPAVRAQAA